jgi:homoaconitase/3-isopropylmalate dehydratase large subunit
MGIDYDAGVYQRKTTLKDGTVMMPGDSKAGKYAGKLSRFSTKTGAVSLEQVLGGGYLWTQLFKFMPLQGRAAIEFVTGQKDAFDFMMELTGTKYGRTYPK